MSKELPCVRCRKRFKYITDDRPLCVKCQQWKASRDANAESRSTELLQLIRGITNQRRSK